VDIHESLKSILESKPVFGERFYRIFFERCPDAEALFTSIDMRRQALVLTMALTLFEQHYTHGYAAVEQYLKHLGNRHKERLVPAEMYSQWRDSMLVTLAEFHGDQWDDALEAQWTDAIDGVSQAMIDGYDEHVGI
jgi:hemoglobin-like flavoprotein